MSARALLISADANTCGVLGQVLAEMGLTVEECPDVPRAARKVASQLYDVIVVDCPEPELASQVLRQARTSPFNKNALEVCVVDGQTSVRSAFAVGANFILYRPVSADRARASLRAASPLIRREKRRHPRTPVHTQATIDFPSVENAPATLLELGEEGLSIQCERRIPAKSKIYLRFTLPGQMKWIQLSGDTVWQDSTGRVGIRFVDVPQSARRLLKEWLTSRISVQESKVMIELPVGQPGRLAQSPADRRVQSRHTCRLGADVYRVGSDVPNRCILSDISTGGCYVETTSPFESGTTVEMVVRTDDFKFCSRGVVQVVNRGFGMGVEFASQTDEQRAQVQHLIKLVFQHRTADADPVLRL